MAPGSWRRAGRSASHAGGDAFAQGEPVAHARGSQQDHRSWTADRVCPSASSTGPCCCSVSISCRGCPGDPRRCAWGQTPRPCQGLFEDQRDDAGNGVVFRVIEHTGYHAPRSSRRMVRHRREAVLVRDLRRQQHGRRRPIRRSVVRNPTPKTRAGTCRCLSLSRPPRSSLGPPGSRGCVPALWLARSTLLARPDVQWDLHRHRAVCPRFDPQPATCRSPRRARPCGVSVWT